MPQRYAVIGSPIAHSLSPVMQLAAFAACGIEATYEAIEATRDQAQSTMLRLREHAYRGWNVTTPLKEAVLPHVDVLSEEASRSRAINVIRREPDGSLRGHNVDGAGFIRALSALWAWEPRAATVVILGSGPAARSIALALRDSGVGKLLCWSRNAARAAEIGSPGLPHADLVVSALPASAQIPPGMKAVGGDETIVFDLNYSRDRSPVEDVPGLRRSNGLPLLLHQGALSFEWWTGIPAPLAVMRDALATDST